MFTPIKTPKDSNKHLLELKQQLEAFGEEGLSAVKIKVLDPQSGKIRVYLGNKPSIAKDGAVHVEYYAGQVQTFEANQVLEIRPALNQLPETYGEIDPLADRLPPTALKIDAHENFYSVSEYRSASSVRGSLNGEVLDISAIMSGKEENSALRVADQIPLICAHFKGRFKKIKIEVRDTPDEQQQMREFLRWVGQGKSLSDAAKSTAEGKAAAQMGFSEAEVEVVNGSPGHYQWLKYHFYSPEDYQDLQRFRKRFPPQPPGVRIKDREMNDRVYHVVDEQESHLHAKGELDPSGGLSLWIYTKKKIADKDEHPGGLRGKDQFDRIMKHFEGRVSMIKANWVRGDNLDKFNQLARERSAQLGRDLGPEDRAELEEIAKKTWTGEQAKRYGFTKAAVYALYSKEDKRFAPVEVDFTKP